jgi:hypothetical protein
MVPSDLISSLALRGHAPHRASQSTALGASPFSSPATVFTGHRINASRRTASCCRSGPVARNGLSLARNGCSSRSFHYEVNVSGLLLRFLPLAYTARSDLRSATESGSPRTMAASLHKPRCSTCVRFDWLLSRLQLPLRTITSLRIKAKIGLAAIRPAFRIRPIPSRSPLLFLLLVAITDQRSWFATFPEACSVLVRSPEFVPSRIFS